MLPLLKKRRWLLLSTIPGLIGFIVWPSSSSSIHKATRITIADSSGHPLRSLFDGVAPDSHYPVFKRAAAERRPSCGRNVSESSKVWRLLGLSFNTVVHADPECSGCGNAINNFFSCTECGGAPYDGELNNAPPQNGIKTGPIECQGDMCPGVASTVNCTCDPV
jgi:hypothetical protein